MKNCGDQVSVPLPFNVYCHHAGSGGVLSCVQVVRSTKPFAPSSSDGMIRTYEPAGPVTCNCGISVAFCPRS